MFKSLNRNYIFSQLLADNRTILMGFSIICIMLYHQSWYVDGPIFQWFQLLGYLGVEVFLLISGFGIAHSLRKNNIRTFYKNRIVRLMPACVVYGILKLIVNHIPGMPQSNDFFLCDLFSISHWYIYAIIVYYAISPLLFKTVNKFGWWFLIAVCALSYIVICFWPYFDDVNYFVKYGRWIVKRLPVFVLGITIAQKPLNLRPIAYSSFGISIMFANLLCLHYVIAANANADISTIPTKFFIYLPDRTVIPDNGRYLLDMMSVFFLCPIFAIGGKVFNKLHILPVITWVGTASLELYLCHQYIYKIIEKIIIDATPSVKLIIAIILVFIVAYTIKISSKLCLTLFIKGSYKRDKI